FNVADSAISVGVVVLLVDGLRSSIKRHTTSTHKDSQQSQ
ncbi:MAG: hypothetical protein ACWGOW_09410, partial [Gammaproteobacteria bacterium]